MNTIVEDFISSGLRAHSFIRERGIKNHKLFSEDSEIENKIIHEKDIRDYNVHVIKTRRDYNGQTYKYSDVEVSTHRNRNYYPYISMNNLKIAERILLLLKYCSQNKIKISYFLDVGCGPAVTLEIAELFGLKPFGIEISPVTANIALEKFPEKIFVGDAFNFDFKQLEETLIYTYMPIRNSALMIGLGKKITGEIKEGNIWTEMYPVYNFPRGSYSDYGINTCHKVGRKLIKKELEDWS